MSEVNNAPPTSPEPPEQQGGGALTFLRERINWPATLAVSAAATFGATIAVHAAHFREGSPEAGIQKFLTPDVFGIDYHTSTERQYDRHHTVVRRRHYSYGSTADNFYLDKGNQAYARDFSQDPAAGEYTRPNELEGIVSNLAGNVRIGYEIKDIKITGFASAEDDSKDGGLTTPSEKNQALAQKRAATVKKELEQAIQENPDLRKATEGANITFGEPVEQELTKGQARRIENMARQAGFENARALVDAWNTGADVPEADSKALAKLLGDARRVEVHVAYGHPARDVTLKQKYCVRYHIDAIQTHKQHQPDHLPLPLPIFIPIPLIRRKGGRNLTETNGPEDEPTEPEPKKPVSEEPVDEVVDHDVIGNGDGLVSPARTVPGRYTYEDIARQSDRSGRIANTFAGFTGALLVAGVLLVNVSGENCHGDGHTPRPWLIDAIWENIDDSAGRGADVAQTISIGIPFVSGAQIDLGKREPGNIWGLDGEKACEKPGPATTGPAPRPPACSQVDIVRRNGKTVSKRTVYQAPPISSQRVIKQHRR